MVEISAAGYFVALLVIAMGMLMSMRSRAHYAGMAASLHALERHTRAHDDQLASIGRRLRRLAPLEELKWQPPSNIKVTGDPHAPAHIGEADTPSPYGQRVPILPSRR